MRDYAPYAMLIVTFTPLFADILHISLPSCFLYAYLTYTPELFYHYHLRHATL